MTSPTERGRIAETHAANHLIRAGHEVIHRNWRNRWCELDLVTRHDGIIHFVEVKYRHDTRYGFAAEYVSRDKISRLIRAASAWNQAHRYDGQYQIDVVTVEGDLDAPIIEYLPNIVG
jgi:putative endonuclease